MPDDDDDEEKKDGAIVISTWLDSSKNDTTNNIILADTELKDMIKAFERDDAMSEFFFGLGLIQFRTETLLIDQQINEHSTSSSYFNAVLTKTLPEIKQIFRALNKNQIRFVLSKRDQLGGSLLHTAYTFGKYDVARYLVTLCPELSVQRYVLTD